MSGSIKVNSLGLRTLTAALVLVLSLCFQGVAKAQGGLSITPGPYKIELPEKSASFTITNRSTEFVALNVDLQELPGPKDFGVEQPVPTGAKSPIIVHPTTVQISPGQEKTVRLQWRGKWLTPPKYYHVLVTQVKLEKAKGVELSNNFKIPLYVEEKGGAPKHFVEQRKLSDGAVMLTILNHGNKHDYLTAYALGNRQVVKAFRPLLPQKPITIRVEANGGDVIAVHTDKLRWFGARNAH
ncbi:MAG: hypothetical protein ACPG1C_04875 [Alphaproteobacteria bacterium]